MNLQIPEDHAPRLYFRTDAADHAKVVLVGSSTTPSRRFTTGADRNRVAMLDQVRAIWITGFLHKSLFHEMRILLGLNERPDAVARPMNLLARPPDENERPLPSGTRILDVFDDMDQALLILGAPGSGKTTLLLELARDLLTRAIHDREHPIPVIFPLSAWPGPGLIMLPGKSFLLKSYFVGWLARELCLRYDVPYHIAYDWAETDQVLPLLDGLDEVKAEYRAACVDAINDFRHMHGLRPLVITSRTADYQALAKPLRLHGATLVRPLSHEQVNGYLIDLGPLGEPVRKALRDDPSLWDLLDSPLMLNIVTVAYHSQSTAAPVSGTAAERRDYLFGLYVNQMLRRRAAADRYTPEKTVHWLSWLAFQMAHHSQTVFYLELLQEDWLPQIERRTTGVANRPRGSDRTPENAEDQAEAEVLSEPDSRVSIRRLFLALVVVPVLIVVLILGPVPGLVFALLFVPAWFLFLVLPVFHKPTLGEIEKLAVPNDGMHRSTRYVILISLVAGLAFGLVFGRVFGPVSGLVAGLVAWLFLGLEAGLVPGQQPEGVPCLIHLVLRLRLIGNRLTPWRFVRFLDFAAERILLRKVGGGYSFMHRLLLEHFAERYVDPLVSESRYTGTSSNKADGESLGCPPGQSLR
jgi:hypothetical protein